jgi:hypothetical protein
MVGPCVGPRPGRVFVRASYFEATGAGDPLASATRRAHPPAENGRGLTPNVAIDDKPTAAWGETDLRELCAEQRREQPRLEFKRELSLQTDREKRDVEEDAQGLANAGGGTSSTGLQKSNSRTARRSHRNSHHWQTAASTSD